jgi:OFA family oxalate/formate antiporter-like MFS transporter
LLTYGTIYTTGVGFCYFPALVAGWQWHAENKKGFVTGVVLGAFGFGSFIFGFLSTWIINPDNVKASIKTEDGRVFFDATIAARVPGFL